MSKASLKDIAAFILVSSLLWQPVAAFKANRLSRGVPLSLSSLMGLDAWQLALAFAAIILLAFLLYRRKANSVIRMLRFSFSLMPALLIFYVSSSLGAFSSETSARFGLGMGFWLASLGAVMLTGDRRPSAYALLLMAVSVILVMHFGFADNISIYKEYLNRRSTFLSEVSNHLKLSFLSAAAAIAPGVLLGYMCHVSKRARTWVMGFINLVQVLPTLSLLGLIMLPLTSLSTSIPLLGQLGIRGIGFAPAFIALGLYCLLPITLNTLAGFSSIDQRALYSAHAMGMTERQILMKIKIPLAFPVIFSGIRTAITQNVGNATIAGLVGGGGMGTLIFLGLSQAAPDLVLLGTIPVIILALVLDGALVSLETGIKKAVMHGND